ncbi:MULTISPECIES: YeeE/YedE family protein [unclassified Bradyrhizobium]|nr:MULTISPECIES: YeeE/YedE family protein [unclassified Bradyrhizobium]
MITPFTPGASLAGGVLIGLSAVILMAFLGRIAGVSGIAARLLGPMSSDAASGLAFIAGLVGAPLVLRLACGALPPLVIGAGNLALVAAGLLVGFGAVWGNGCTSGHGICGISRLSRRSMVATLVFMGMGFATVFIIRHAI